MQRCSQLQVISELSKQPKARLGKVPELSPSSLKERGAPPPQHTQARAKTAQCRQHRTGLSPAWLNSHLPLSLLSGGRQTHPKGQPPAAEATYEGAEAPFPSGHSSQAKDVPEDADSHRRHPQGVEGAVESSKTRD